MTNSFRAYDAGNPVRIGIIGAGAVSDYHHVPGIRLDPRARLVAACDTSRELLEQRRGEWGIDRAHDRSGGAVRRPGGRRGDHRHAQLHPSADRRWPRPGAAST